MKVVALRFPVDGCTVTALANRTSSVVLEVESVLFLRIIGKLRFEELWVCVTLVSLLALLFQLVISLLVIVAAALAPNTGSVSVVMKPLSLVRSLVADGILLLSAFNASADATAAFSIAL